jgi:hypothetical protein
VFVTYGITSAADGLASPPFDGGLTDKTDPDRACDGATPHAAAWREVRVEPRRTQPAIDRVDVASMDSFPCSDPPGYIGSRA